MDEIIPHLYISNWKSSNDIDLIKKNNIKAVITVETQMKPEYIIRYYNENNIDFLYLYIEDNINSDMSVYFDASYDFIYKHIKNNENVLVHCWAGISRSSTIILNYLLRRFYMPNKCVSCNLIFFLNFMKKYHPNTKPNDAFMKQLYIQALKYGKNDIKYDFF
jgi:protein-tyrosine phosphatase